MEDGIIEPAPDSAFGYTADLFDGYLWKTGCGRCRGRCGRRWGRRWGRHEKNHHRTRYETFFRTRNTEGGRMKITPEQMKKLLDAQNSIEQILNEVITGQAAPQPPLCDCGKEATQLLCDKCYSKVAHTG